MGRLWTSTKGVDCNCRKVFTFTCQEDADVCKCITPDVLDVEVERMSVMIYEDNLGVL
ncbi:hypothetical protein F2Q68_00024479 [Brassica cretica]|uniref:Uncharacterized protein n=1 Tax=Brassica cretica TaxID=69181 RepID=A0A8S9I9U2_BRACR|nr:hypothetical protein F2Q68_00024479 [Brassica cretica]